MLFNGSITQTTLVSPPTTEQTLFGIMSSQHAKNVTRKLNYTLLFMRYYIYTSKLYTKAITLQEFKNKVLIKYQNWEFILDMDYLEILN